MTKNLSLKQQATAIFSFAVLLVCAGCPGGSGTSGPGSGGSSPPTVTVKVKNTDCDLKDLMISNIKVEEDNSGGALHLKISATVTCKGQPLNGATLIAIVPGASSNPTMQTDAQGQGATDFLNPNNKTLVGQTVGVSVEGEDGKQYPQGSAMVTKAP